MARAPELYILLKLRVVPYTGEPKPWIKAQWLVGRLRLFLQSGSPKSHRPSHQLPSHRVTQLLASCQPSQSLTVLSGGCCKA
jgi:hypothetical protein